MNGPKLHSGRKLPGLAAVALFAVFAYVFVTATFPGAEGFPADANITASIGYAMFDFVDSASVPTEGMLAVFLVVALVLDAALGGAVMLARRDQEGES